MIHNFEKSLQRERNKANEADLFYRNVFHATEIIRYNSDNEFDMEFQRKDIDLTLTIENQKYHVSEKFRETDYGDLYVEFYSKYPHVKGWMHTGSPDIIVYFTPNFIYRIIHRGLENFCLEKLFPQIPEKCFFDIHSSGKSIVREKIILNERLIPINLIQAHNKPSTGSSWETIGLSISFDILEENGVKIKKYPNTKTIESEATNKTEY